MTAFDTSSAPGRSAMGRRQFLQVSGAAALTATALTGMPQLLTGRSAAEATRAAPRGYGVATYGRSSFPDRVTPPGATPAA